MNDDKVASWRENPKEVLLSCMWDAFEIENGAKVGVTSEVRDILF